MNVLLPIGIAILCSLAIGKYTHRVKLPAVIGYLLVGLILGPSVLKLFSAQMLDHLHIINDLALSVIAFIIGCEIHLNTFKRMGKKIVAIMLSEQFGAFLAVTLGVYILTGKLTLAVILGALAPASAPAGTATVLQEYRAKGPLTETLYDIVGLDDGFAIIIYAFAVASVKFYMEGSISFLDIFKGPFLEIIGSIFLGCLLGIMAGYLVKRIQEENIVFTLALGAIFLCTGLSKQYHFSLILANLVLGTTFGNLFPDGMHRTKEVMDVVSLPVFIIFFILAGAHLQLDLLPSLGGIGVIYIICRTAGKLGGAWLGAFVSRADDVIRKYVGLGILSQAGVAIGLAISATQHFPAGTGREFSKLIVNIVTATTIIFEIMGPIGVKWGISRAGEVHKKGC